SEETSAARSADKILPRPPPRRPEDHNIDRPAPCCWRPSGRAPRGSRSPSLLYFWPDSAFPKPAKHSGRVEKNDPCFLLPLPLRLSLHVPLSPLIGAST